MVGKGFVELLTVEVEGVEETNYRITKAGIIAFQRFLDSGRKIPKMRGDKSRYVNNRYLNSE